MGLRGMMGEGPPGMPKLNGSLSDPERKAYVAVGEMSLVDLGQSDLIGSDSDA
jgi:hypothetical protein